MDQPPDSHGSDQEGKNDAISAYPEMHTMEEYIQAVKSRHAHFHPSEEARHTRKGYVIDPVGAALHGAHIHAMSISKDSSILLSGGSDGYIRWYDLPASMNGNNMLTQNLRNSFVEGVTKVGVLMTWWGHSHLERGADPDTSAAEAPLSAVHSLACQREALWGVSGGESGTINLWGLRHGAGSIRHVLHKHTDAVSALQLDPSEEHLISGGWDRGVYQWDLNTGQIVRSFDGHTGQVSNIAFRPLYVPGEQPIPDAALYPSAPEAMDVDAIDDDLEQELNRTLSEQAPDDAQHDTDAEGDNDSLFGGERDGPTSDSHAPDQDAEGDTDNDDADEKPFAGRHDTPHLADTKSTGASISLPGQPSKSEPKSELRAPEPKSHLPKPLFGSMNTSWHYDADLRDFSQDILLTSTLSGQVMLWDRRVDTKSKHGVRALGLPHGTPPWCTGTCWNHTGDKIYVGRRNELVEEWDVRMLPDITSNPGSRSQNGAAPAYLRALRLPRGSGPVSSVAVMPNNRHIVCGSFDNVRLWDLEATGQVPFKIVAGHHGGMISHILMDPCARFLMTGSGDRGWFASSTETLLMHEISAL